MSDKIIQRGHKVVDLAALGFHAGGNGADCSEGIEQIDAIHSQSIQKLEASRAKKLGALEAQRDTLSRLVPQAQDRWEQLQSRYRQDPPRVLIPLLLFIFGLITVIAEASLLAPVLDMFRVTDPVLQLILALVISLGCALLMHRALDSRREQSSVNWPLLSSAVGALLFLVGFGIWRARALSFAATHSKSALSSFMTDNIGLTTFVMSSLTVLIPLTSAFTFDYGLHYMWQWWEFRKARRAAESLGATLDSVSKELDAEKKKLSAEIAAIQEQNEEWQAQYRHFWQLGKENGAKKGPLWPVWLKSAAVVLGIIAVGLLLALWGVRGAVLISGVVGVSAGLAAAAHFYHQWEHPSAEQFLRNANTQFTDIDTSWEQKTGSHVVVRMKDSELRDSMEHENFVGVMKGGAQ